MHGSYEHNRSQLLSGWGECWPETIWGLFDAAARRYGGRDLVCFSDGTGLTYAEAHRHASALAEILGDMGVREGMPIALQSGNRTESLLLSLALSKIGAVKVSINAAVEAYELAHALRQTRACMLFCEDVEKALRASREERNLPFLQAVVGLERCEGFSEAESLRFRIMQWESVCSERDVAVACPEECRLQACDVMFTSGTSGFPKAVVLEDDQLIRVAFANCMNRGFEDGRRLYVPIPLFHVYGYVEGFLAALFVGGALLMNRGKLTSVESLKFASRAKANDILAVPSLMASFVDVLEENPIAFPSIHSVYCSASSCSSRLWDRIGRGFGVSDVITGYGMTEVGGASFQTSPFDPVPVLRRFAGHMVGVGGREMPFSDPNIVYRVYDVEGDRECEEGIAGELICKGPTVTRGYLDEGKILRTGFDEEGWFHTGDIGRLTADGYLELSGRAGESYKINGENVSVAFVEGVMDRFDGIAATKVVGIPDGKLGAVGVAFVQLKNDTERNRERFQAYCADSLARYQTPKYYWYLTDEEWPRTATGKVRSGILRQRAEDRFGVS